MSDKKKSNTVEATPAGKVANAAADTKKAEASILTPSQAIGVFTEPMAKDEQRKLKTIYETILDGFSAEGQSKISIGRALNEAKALLGETFGKFLADCVVKALRKSQQTCYNYMALATAAVHQFSANKVFADALFRIWSAEGCFDTQNGELKPVVKEAIGAIGGVPESTDSATCEQAARQFVNAVDRLVSKSREAQPGGRKWDAETIAKKQAAVVKSFHSFLTNKSVSARKAIALLSALMVEALVEMSAADINAAIDTARAQVKERKSEINRVAEEQKAA